MQSHGLPGKIPSSFTTGPQGAIYSVYRVAHCKLVVIMSVCLVGKPYFENIQYNTPIEMYDDGTVDEMVKIMNSPTTNGLVTAPFSKPETLDVVDTTKAHK